MWDFFLGQSFVFVVFCFVVEGAVFFFGGGRFGCRGFGCDLILPYKKGWFEDVKSETVSKFSVMYMYIYIYIYLDLPSV